jgi:hypothetical protein
VNILVSFERMSTCGLDGIQAKMAPILGSLDIYNEIRNHGVAACAIQTNVQLNRTGKVCMC